MTVIVGLVDKKTVYIGGDSAGINGSSIQYRKDPKVFRRGNFIYGFTSSFRMGQLLMCGDLNIRNKTKKEDVYEYMVTAFIPAIRTLFSDGGFMKKESGEESGGTFMVGYEGRLFEIHNDFQVAEQLDNFGAVGCGDDLALGSLFTTKDMDLVPEQKILLALEASTHFSNSVSKPFKIIKL